MDEYLGVSYKLSKSENFEDFMKALGVGLVMRKLANSTTPTIKLTKEDGVYAFHTLSTFKNITIKFKEGEEFVEETMDGRKVKSTIHFDKNKMIQNQKGEKEIEITREFSPTNVTATFVIGNVKSQRVYDRV